MKPAPPAMQKLEARDVLHLTFCLVFTGLQQFMHNVAACYNLSSRQQLLTSDKYVKFAVFRHQGTGGMDPC